MAEAHEQRVVALMRRFRNKELSLREIGRELIRRGINTRNGRPRHPDVIARILRNPLHVRAQAVG